jgi:hypothetical protein
MSPSPGQTPVGPAARSPEKAAQIQAEIARMVQSLDVLLDQVSAAMETAKTTLDQARRAESQATDVELDRDAKIANDLQAQLDGLASRLAEDLARIRDLRDKAAARVVGAGNDPLAQFRLRILATEKLPSLSDAEAALRGIETDLLSDRWKRVPGADQVLDETRSRLADTLWQRILATPKLPSLGDVEAALVAIEAEQLTDKWKKNPAAEPLLGLTRYRLADTLRQESTVEIGQKNNSRAAEKLMLRACTKFNDVLSTVDSPNSGEGSSLHAVALRRVVQIQATLYDGYRQMLAQQPSSQAFADSARKYREASTQAFEKLRRLHPDATMPDGSSVVEVAREDARRVTR